VNSLASISTIRYGRVSPSICSETGFRRGLRIAPIRRPMLDRYMLKRLAATTSPRPRFAQKSSVASSCSTISSTMQSARPYILRGRPRTGAPDGVAL